MKKLVPVVLMLGLCLGMAGEADAWVAAKAGGQFFGSMGTPLSINSGSLVLPGGKPVSPGYSLAVELDIPIGGHLALGGGVQYLVGRGIKDLPGYFSFLPLYGQAQVLRFGKDHSFRPYIKGQVGYNFFFTSSNLDNNFSSLSSLASFLDTAMNGGLYWSAGIGTYIFKYVLVEVMYMENRANVSGNILGVISTDYGTTYRSLNVYAGIHF